MKKHLGTIINAVLNLGGITYFLAVGAYFWALISALACGSTWLSYYIGLRTGRRQGFNKGMEHGLAAGFATGVQVLEHPELKEVIGGLKVHAKVIKLEEES